MSNSYFAPQPELFGRRVVKYIRCSHEGQVLHGDTLETQNMLLDDFIRVNRLVLVDTFVDEALTARKKYTKRKEFVRLLDGVRAHNFDLILFTKLDRWFRNIGDYHQIQAILEANDVQWKAILESYDTTTTNGRLHINIRLSVAQDECDRDSDRIKDVFAYKLKNKTFISGNVPRGLMLDEEKHIVHNPETKQWALDLFDFIEATGSAYSARMLLFEKYGSVMSERGIIHAAKSALYKGMYRDDPEFCEPLIDPERFDRIQDLLARARRFGKVKYSYIFSGLLVCSSCNHNLVGATLTTKNLNGNIHRYTVYRCNTHTRQPRLGLCDRVHSIHEEYVEEYMLEHIRPALSEYLSTYGVTSQEAKRSSQQADADKIRKKMEKLFDLYMDDVIEKEEYCAKREDLESQLKECQAAPVPAPAPDLDKLRDLLSRDWESVYATFSKSEKNAFWKSFVRSVIVYGDKHMDIYFL